jgi:hypothetical protein
LIVYRATGGKEVAAWSTVYTNWVLAKIGQMIDLLLIARSSTGFSVYTWFI